MLPPGVWWGQDTPVLFPPSPLSMGDHLNNLTAVIKKGKKSRKKCLYFPEIKISVTRQ